MLARLAENLFWAGRHLVRAEDTARMVDVTWHVLLESPPTEVAGAWEELLDVLHQTAGFHEWQAGRSGDLVAIRPEEVVRWLVAEPTNPGSVLSTATLARENVRSVRELVSSEVWETVNDLHLTLGRRDVGGELDDQPWDLFRTVKQLCQSVVGVAYETMPRDDAYRFLALGRALERAEMTCRLVSVRYPQLTEDPTFQHWSTVLRSVGALEAFRKRYRLSTDPRDVVAFLVLEPDLPRSVVFALDRAMDGLGRLGAPDGLAARRLGRARAALQYRDIDDLLDIGLQDMLERIQVEIREVTDAISKDFFRHAPSGALHAVGAA